MTVISNLVIVKLFTFSQDIALKSGAIVRTGLVISALN
jgi:hypothetical protein